MDFGLPYLIELNDPERCAAAARESGLQFVELNMSFPSCTCSCLSPRLIEYLKMKYGVYFTLHLDEQLQPVAYDDAVSAVYTQCAVDAVTLARETGMPRVNLHWPAGVYITLPDRRVFINQVYHDACMERVRRFRDACEQASQGMVQVNIENVEQGWFPFQNEEIEELMKADCFGLTLDVGHAHVAGEKDEPFFQKHADRLRHMHLHDASGNRCHLPLGSGEIDLKRTLQRAADAGLSPVIEVKTLKDLQRSAALVHAYI